MCLEIVLSKFSLRMGPSISLRNCVGIGELFSFPLFEIYLCTS